MVRGSVEGTLNMMLGAEAGESCQAQRYDRSENQIETWTGHDTQKGLAEACEVALSMPKLRRPNLGAAIIVR
jgi:transposase-like protein